MSVACPKYACSRAHIAVKYVVRVLHFSVSIRDATVLMIQPMIPRNKRTLLHYNCVIKTKIRVKFMSNL